jgi:DNA repair protein RAD5
MKDLPRALPEASGSKPRLFFADSEDEDETYASYFATPKKRNTPVLGEKYDTSSDIEMPSFKDIPRASSVTSLSSVPFQRDGASSPAPSVESIERPTKKRRVTSVTDTSQVPFESIYLGSFIVGNAWSTVKGQGYVKSGDQIQVERNQDERPSVKEAAAAKAKKGKTPNNGKTKQLSIATMMKAPQLKTSKKKTNTVVRLTNSRGFGMLFLHCALDEYNISVKNLGGFRQMSRHGYQSSLTKVSCQYHLVGCS